MTTPVQKFTPPLPSRWSWSRKRQKIDRSDKEKKPEQSILKIAAVVAVHTLREVAAVMAHRKIFATALPVTKIFSRSSRRIETFPVTLITNLLASHPPPIMGKTLTPPARGGNSRRQFPLYCPRGGGSCGGTWV